MTITSGKYKATLFDAVKYKTNEEHDAVRFVWDLCGLGQRTTSTFTPLDARGLTDVMAIHDVRKWANDWDGRDLDWFAAQLKNGTSFDVWLVISDGQVELALPREEKVEVEGLGEEEVKVKGEEEVKVKGEGEQRCESSSVNLNRQPHPRCYSNVPVVIKLEVDRDVLLHIPEKIEPNAENAKTLFDAMTEKTQREDANLVWTLMAEKIGPMQIDFKAEQWAQMIEKIKGLSSCSFVMREGRR